MKLIYLSLVLMLSGCSLSKESDALLILDQTEERSSIDEDLLFSAYKNMAYGSVIITEIRDQFLTKKGVVKKPKSPSYWLQVETEERQKEANFKKDFKEELTPFNSVSERLSESFVYSVVAPHLKILANSTADHKAALIFSDLCENTPEFSFYKYSNNPYQIMKEYQQIVQKLEHQNDALTDTDLSGVSISVIYHPSKENDLLLREVRKFWHRYFTSKNAQIEFVLSLKSSSQILKL